MQQKSKSWLLLFYIWGVQWVTSGILDFFNETELLKTIKVITLLLAALASLLIILLLRSKIIALPEFKKQSLQTNTLLFPLFVLMGSLILLWFISESDTPLILHVVRMLFLAFFYVLVGALFSKKELIWLGCWLFALVVTVSVRYLGYSPFVFEGMGGLSLLACGWILQGMNNE
jgi:hypothetical protein